MGVSGKKSNDDPKFVPKNRVHIPTFFFASGLHASATVPPVSMETVAPNMSPLDGGVVFDTTLVRNE
jgi:hypothetical protein